MTAIPRLRSSGALAHGMREVAVYGALGGRLDHTLATLSALVGAARAGMHAVAVGEGNVVVALAGGMSLEIAAKNTGTFSVFSAPDASCGLTEFGPLYEVENATLRNDVTLGLSNEFVGKPVSISLERGAVVVVLPANALERHSHRLNAALPFADFCAPFAACAV